MPIDLNNDQKIALTALEKTNNVFITGAAGSGKSFLLRHYLKDKQIPILASTGAAAILVGGRTFHSFFGLGIMEGGVQATVDRATQNKRVMKRLKKVHSIIIDEVSMISGPTLRAAEQIARKARENTSSWGGLRVIAVGDFAQLPPVNPYNRQREWAFLEEAWQQSEFQNLVLNKIMRSTNDSFLKILNQIRVGKTNEDVRDFLNSRVQTHPEGEMTRLFPRRDEVERFNLKKLEEIPHPIETFQTIYTGTEKDIENFRKHSPIPDVIQIKREALIMIRQNDVEGRWVNGSLGKVKHISAEYLSIELLSGQRIELAKAEFTLLDAEGNPVVMAQNFPVTLAWAMTIHKAQGATLDRMFVNLQSLWEPGQAYVALSRVREPEGLFIEAWNTKSIFSDPAVESFHSRLLPSTDLIC